MNFTREPLILSVITPKEGSKLLVRNSLLEGQEDYFVDAVEVVSFEGAIFYRSLEKPKSFILPVSSYEVLEVKEARMVLKSVEQEKSIKIGGGAKPFEERGGEKGKEKKRSKRRKPSSMPPSAPQELVKKEQMPGEVEAETHEVSAPPAPPSPAPSSMLKKIFPPPNTLIKEKLARYKNEEFFEDNILPLMDESKAERKSSDTEPDTTFLEDQGPSSLPFGHDDTKVDLNDQADQEPYKNNEEFGEDTDSEK